MIEWLSEPTNAATVSAVLFFAIIVLIAVMLGLLVRACMIQEKRKRAFEKEGYVSSVSLVKGSLNVTGDNLNGNKVYVTEDQAHRIEAIIEEGYRRL